MGNTYYLIIDNIDFRETYDRVTPENIVNATYRLTDGEEVITFPDQHKNTTALSVIVEPYAEEFKEGDWCEFITTYCDKIHINPYSHFGYAVFPMDELKYKKLKHHAIIGW